MIANGLRVRAVFTQDCRPGAFSVVPFDKLRAGSAGLIAIRPDSRFVFRECCPNQPIEKS